MSKLAKRLVREAQHGVAEAALRERAIDVWRNPDNYCTTKHPCARCKRTSVAIQAALDEAARVARDLPAESAEKRRVAMTIAAAIEAL